MELMQIFSEPLCHMKGKNKSTASLLNWAFFLMGFLLCEFSSCCLCAFRLGLHTCGAWGCLCWSAFRVPVLTHTCSNTLKCVFLWQDLSANRRLTSRSERGGGFPLPVLQCVWEEDGCYHDLWIGQQFPTGQRWQEWLDRGMQLDFFLWSGGLYRKEWEDDKIQGKQGN